MASTKFLMHFPQRGFGIFRGSWRVGEWKFSIAVMSNSVAVFVSRFFPFWLLRVHTRNFSAIDAPTFLVAEQWHCVFGTCKGEEELEGCGRVGKPWNPWLPTNNRWRDRNEWPRLLWPVVWLLLLFHHQQDPKTTIACFSGVFFLTECRTIVWHCFGILVVFWI